MHILGPQHREFRKEILQTMQVGVGPQQRNTFSLEISISYGSGTEMIFSQNLFRRPTPARLTRIEKSLLQAHFRSVNYCQYNFVEHRTLIYVPA